MAKNVPWTREVVKVKFLTSTKAMLLEEAVNKTIKKLEEEGYIIKSIDSNISYTGDKGCMGYMILCQITYVEEVEYDVTPQYDVATYFGTGMSLNESDHHN